MTALFFVIVIVLFCNYSYMTPRALCFDDDDDGDGDDGDDDDDDGGGDDGDDEMQLGRASTKL
jgi:hypothetical protein